MHLHGKVFFCVQESYVHTRTQPEQGASTFPVYTFLCMCNTYALFKL